MTLKDKIRDAQALAGFANLTARDVEYFRRNYPEFVPNAWWDYQPTDREGKPRSWAQQYSPESTKQWQQNQACLRGAWREQFHIELYQLIELLLSVFDPRDVFETLIGPDTPDLPAFSDEFVTGRLDPYHRAVLFLHEQNWRARLCQRCKSPFVAGHSKQKYCGSERGEDRETCFDLARREQRRRDHLKHRKARNRKKRAEYAKLVTERGA